MCVCLWAGCEGILVWYEDGESLKFRGGVVIPVLPPPVAGGVTSSALMTAAHQLLGSGAIKGSPVQCLS